MKRRDSDGFRRRPNVSPWWARLMAKLGYFAVPWVIGLWLVLYGISRYQQYSRGFLALHPFRHEDELTLTLIAAIVGLAGVVVVMGLWTMSVLRHNREDALENTNAIIEALKAQNSAAPPADE